MWYYTARMGEKNSHVLTLVLPGSAVGFVGMILEMALPARDRVLLEATPPAGQPGNVQDDHRPPA
jgi:hypothetical protein